jgi:hypothetical protein
VSTYFGETPQYSMKTHSGVLGLLHGTDGQTDRHDEAIRHICATIRCKNMHNDKNNYILRKRYVIFKEPG